MAGTAEVRAGHFRQTVCSESARILDQAEINLGLFAQLCGHWALKAPLPGLRHGSTFYVSILHYSDYSLLPLLSMGQLGEQPVLKSFNLRQIRHG
jgi:hypothetical protein